MVCSPSVQNCSWFGLGKYLGTPQRYSTTLSSSKYCTYNLVTNTTQLKNENKKTSISEITLHYAGYTLYTTYNDKAYHRQGRQNPPTSPKPTTEFKQAVEYQPSTSVYLGQLKDQINKLDDSGRGVFETFRSEFHRLHVEIMATGVADAATERIRWFGLTSPSFPTKGFNGDLPSLQCLPLNLIPSKGFRSLE